MDSTLVIGDSQRLADFQARTKHLDTPFQFVNTDDKLPDLQAFSVIFDLCLDEQPSRLSQYAPLAGMLVIGGAVKRSLAEMVSTSSMPISCQLAGINALPFFLTKQDWELSCWHEQEPLELTALLKSWKVGYHFVADRVGMVTPRIISMIVNEACFTVQEGTADRAGIDQAMRLGVNYPGGPFEWLDKIGAKHIYEVLLSIGEDTRNGRYKIAPFLTRLQLLAK